MRMYSTRGKFIHWSDRFKRKRSKSWLRDMFWWRFHIWNGVIFWDLCGQTYYQQEGGEQGNIAEWLYLYIIWRKLGWGVKELIYGYPYLKHIIELWTGYWEEHFGMMNEAVCERNKFELKSGRNRWYRYYQITSSLSILVASFQQWSTARKDKGFGENDMNMKMERFEVNPRRD